MNYPNQSMEHTIIYCIYIPEADDNGIIHYQILEICANKYAARRVIANNNITMHTDDICIHQ